MTSVAGASRFVNAATLANTQGRAAASPQGIFGGIDLADALSLSRPDNGIGLSRRARSLNSAFLKNTASLSNQLLSLTIGPGSDVDGARQQILALRSKLPKSQIAPSLRGENIDTKA